MNRLLSFILTMAATVGIAAQSAYMIPQSTALPLTTRQANVSNLVTSLQWGLVGAAVPETYPVLTNFVMRARAQTISGANTFSGANLFTGANILSNTTQRFVGGYLSNVTRMDATYGSLGSGTGTAILSKGALIVSNSYPYNYIQMVDPSGSADEKNFVITQGNGEVSFRKLLDDGTPVQLLTLTSSEVIFYVPISAATTMRDTLLTNVITTNSIIGATAVYVDGSVGLTNGNVSITNNAAVLSFEDTGGTADDKQTKLVADADTFAVNFYTDAGILTSTPIEITRAAAVAQIINLNADVAVSGTLLATGEIKSDVNAAFTGAVISGDNSASLPASATAGFLAIDALSPSGDPSNGTFMWSDSGVFKYRTSTSGEGNGGDNRVHNRTATTTGAGTDYPFTTSTAAIDFGTTDPSVTIPTAGTYLFMADVRFTNGATVNDEYRFKLRNTTAATDVVSDMIWTLPAASQVMSATIQGTMTCSASDVVTIYGFNNTAVRGTCQSAGTRIRYVRLY